MSESNGNAVPGPIAEPGTPAYDAWLLAQTDPHVLVSGVRRLDIAQRAPYLRLFTELAANRSTIERDTLAEIGKEVWQCRVGVMREAIRDAARGVQADAVIELPCVVGPEYEWIADMLYRPGETPAVQYVVYEFDTGRLTRVPEVKVGPVTYRPPYSGLLETRSMLLSTGVQEYGSDAALLDRLRTYVTKYIALADEQFVDLLCFYILMTWVYDRFSVLPYLRVIGDYGTGKSRVIQVVGSVSYRGLLTGGSVTAAPIFRMITRFHPTLVFDEADFGRSEIWDDITKILNVGYQRGFTLMRAERSGEGGPFDVAGYDCFSPKILATRRRFSDPALESRCLTQTMPLIDLPPHVPSSLEEEFYTEAEVLRNHLLLWRLRSWEHVQVNPFQRFPRVEPRVSQILQPLLACLSHDLHGQVLALVHELMRRSATERSESLEGVIAAALIDEWSRGFREGKPPTKIGLRRVSEFVRNDLGEDRVSDRKVGDIIGRVFGVPTRKEGGLTQVYATSALIDRIREKYVVRGAVGGEGEGEGEA